MFARLAPLGVLTTLVAGLSGCIQAPPPPTVAVASPAEGTAYPPGGTITLSLVVTNFELTDPDAAAAKGLTRHDNGDADHAADHASMEYARQGHYHIYLDQASGSDDHVTAWTESVDVPLPADLAAGEHTLRIELRDNEHNPVGVETTWTFVCVEP